MFGLPIGAFVIRLADFRDGEALKALTEQPMPGVISLSLQTRPSFFSALRVHGNNPKVFVADKAGSLVAMGIASRREVFLDGRPENVGYLSSLRVDPSARGGLTLGRGYKQLLTLQQQEPRLPFYLTSIMEGNFSARKLLTSGRAGLPEYREIGRYNTTVVPLVRRRQSAGNCGIEVRTGEEAGWDPILDCLSRFGPEKQFFPVLTREDFGGENATMPGLGLADFLVAYLNGEVVGTLALWDQRPFRQVVVAKYAVGMRLLVFIARALAPMVGTPRLPKAGEPLGMMYLACIAVKGNAPEFFRCLYTGALELARTRGASFVAVGFFADDPLDRIPQSFLNLTIRSRMYSVFWKDQPVGPRPLDDCCKYIELGSL